MVVLKHIIAKLSKISSVCTGPIDMRQTGFNLRMVALNGLCRAIIFSYAYAILSPEGTKNLPVVEEDPLLCSGWQWAWREILRFAPEWQFRGVVILNPFRVKNLPVFAEDPSLRSGWQRVWREILRYSPEWQQSCLGWQRAWREILRFAPEWQFNKSINLSPASPFSMLSLKKLCLFTAVCPPISLVLIKI